MDENRNLIERMKRIPHFMNLGVRDIATIIQAGHRRKVDPETILFHEGDECGGLYVLLSGEVSLQKIGPEGHQYIMAILQPVTMFNEVAVLDQGLNPATAITNTRSYIWQTGCEQFHQLLNNYPQIALGLLPILAKRNRMLITQYEDLSFLSVRARTAKLLLDLSQNGAETIQRDQHSIQTLSARISTAPEVISRSMRSISQQGLIQYDRLTIKVLKPDGLAQLAHIPPDF